MTHKFGLLTLLCLSALALGGCATTSEIAAAPGIEGFFEAAAAKFSALQSATDDASSSLSKALDSGRALRLDNRPGLDKLDRSVLDAFEATVEGGVDGLAKNAIDAAENVETVVLDESESEAGPDEADERDAGEESLLGWLCTGSRRPAGESLMPAPISRQFPEEIVAKEELICARGEPSAADAAAAAADAAAAAAAAGGAVQPAELHAAGGVPRRARPRQPPRR